MVFIKLGRRLIAVEINHAQNAFEYNQRNAENRSGTGSDQAYGLEVLGIIRFGEHDRRLVIQDASDNGSAYIYGLRWTGNAIETEHRREFIRRISMICAEENCAASGRNNLKQQFQEGALKLIETTKRIDGCADLQKRAEVARHHVQRVAISHANRWAAQQWHLVEPNFAGL